jgi:hypothetical protein
MQGGLDSGGDRSGYSAAAIARFPYFAAHLTFLDHKV